MSDGCLFTRRANAAPLASPPAKQPDPATRDGPRRGGRDDSRPPRSFAGRRGVGRPLSNVRGGTNCADLLEASLLAARVASRRPARLRRSSRG
jgi:hypothetical protein